MRTNIERVEHDVSRRLVLKAGAAIGGGLMIGWRGKAPRQPQPTTRRVFAPNAFVRIDRQGKVSIVSPMAEMGQGVYTALPMLVAEELDADMSNVTVEHSPPSDKLYGNAFLGGVQTTGNSSSIRAFYFPCAKLARRRVPCWSRLLRRNSMWMRVR